jgi:hypothetical protein
MPRRCAVLCLLQAIVYGLAAVAAAERWAPDGVVLGLAAVAQFGAGAATATQRRVAAFFRIAAVISLAALVFQIALVFQLSWHVHVRFGASALGQIWPLLAGLGLLVPWFVTVPIWQIVAARATRKAAAMLVTGGVVLLLLPCAVTVAREAPIHRFVVPDGATAAAWLLKRQQGLDPGPPPTGPGPVLLAATTVIDGKIVRSVFSEGATLEKALSALAITPDAGALYLDAAVDEHRLDAPLLLPGSRALLPPANSGLRAPDRVVGSMELWRKGHVGRVDLSPLLVLPGIDVVRYRASGFESWLRMRSWLADDHDVLEIRQTWSAPPPFSVEAVRDAVAGGATFIAHNQSEDGQYAYIVASPSGERRGSYNYPRHAGATWFLARAAHSTGDPALRNATRKGLDFLWSHTKLTGDGRAYVLDPTRTDGKAWVGTTALALLSLLEFEAAAPGDGQDGVTPGEYAQARQLWAAQVASSVDAEGIVRGNMSQKTGRWPMQAQIAYAQGQALLALAAASRAGVPGVRAPFERAARAVDGRYWPAGGGRFFAMEEHWMCLAALVSQEEIGGEPALRICETWLDKEALVRRSLTGPVLPDAGAAAGLVEALVARAEIDRRAGLSSRWLNQALSYGPVLLSNVYQASDAPLLARPDRLLGGFRDKPWDLDVRVDAVQHIGCALLGIEQLLEGAPLPGGMP